MAAAFTCADGPPICESLLPHFLSSWNPAKRSQLPVISPDALPDFHPNYKPENNQTTCVTHFRQPHVQWLTQKGCKIFLQMAYALRQSACRALAVPGYTQNFLGMGFDGGSAVRNLAGLARLSGFWRKLFRDSEVRASQIILYDRNNAKTPLLA